MVQVIYSQPNREMEAIGQGIAALGQNLFAVKQYENELADAQREIAIEDAQRARALEDRERALKYQAEDRATAKNDRDLALMQDLEDRTYLRGERERQGSDRARLDEERAAAQGFNAGALGLMADDPMQGLAGPPTAFMAQKQAESEGLKRLMGKMSPEAGQRALGTFQEQTAIDLAAEQKRILSQSMVQMRTAVRDLTQQGVMPQDTGSAIYQSLDPALLANADPQTMQAILGELDKTEKAMTAAIDQHADDSYRQLQRSQVEEDLNEELADAQKLMKKGYLTPEQYRDMVRASSRLLAGLATYSTPSQVESALEGIRAMGKPPKPGKPPAEKADPRETMRAKLIEDLVTRGEEIPAENAWSAPGRKTYTYDEAEAIALQRIPEPRREFNFLERPVPRGTPSGAQVTSNVAATSQQAQAAPKLKTRDEFLRGDGGPSGPPVDPTAMRQKVAEAVALGIPLDQFGAKVGLDLDSLSEEDLAEIERLVRSLSGGKR